MVLLLFLCLSFISSNLFMFYLFFKGSLIPTLFFIFGWGIIWSVCKLGFIYYYLLFWLL